MEEVVDGAVKTKVKDMFGFEMITQNKFTTAQIDKNVWTKEMLDLLVDYINTNEAAAKYRDIDWSKEYGLAANGIRRTPSPHYKTGRNSNESFISGSDSGDYRGRRRALLGNCSKAGGGRRENSAGRPDGGEA